MCDQSARCLRGQAIDALGGGDEGSQERGVPVGLAGPRCREERGLRAGDGGLLGRAAGPRAGERGDDDVADRVDDDGPTVPGLAQRGGDRGHRQ